MGIIKKLLGRELVGGTVGDSTEVYPITHVGAVYDSEGKTLEEVIADIQQQIIDGTGGGGGGSSSVYPINYLWAYKASENTPVISNPDQEAITPTGWSQTPVTPDEGEDLYMTTARKQGSAYLKWSNDDVWSTPVRISGGGGTSDTGADGDGYNYIYCLTTTENVPNRPSVITVEAIEQYEGTNYGISTQGVASTERINVWRDHPNGVAPDAGFEWIAVAKSDNGTWGDYSTPTLWSKYGFDGKDGDSIEYIYRLTDANTTPTITYPYTGRIGESGSTVYNVTDNSVTYQTDDFILSDWHDNPQSLSVSNPVQWVSVRKSNNGVWGRFSTPTKWSENSITETIVDAPYIITNDNPWIGVACDYNGNPVITSGSYGMVSIKALKGSTNVTNSFNWTASASGVTPGSSSGSTEFILSPRSLTVDKAEITVTGTLISDSSIVVSTKVTVAKIKASQPGTIPTIYELVLSKPFAIKGDTTITNSVDINVSKVDGSGRSSLSSLQAIRAEGLHLYINDTSQEITGDNVLSKEELTQLFTSKQVGESITIILRDTTDVWDYGYITLIATGGTNIINNYDSDDFVFTLVTNNHTVELVDIVDNVATFNPQEVVYEIAGSWDTTNTSLSGISMKGLFPETDTLTDSNSYLTINPAGNCRAYVTHDVNVDKVYLHIVPISTIKGGSVTINCFRDLLHNDYWGTLVASYNLEMSQYKITQNNKGLGLNGLSTIVNDMGETLENHESLLTHTSKQLTSTIESQNVFSNLFGFTNGLTFDNSEPFIQGYGAEIIPGSVPSGISGFNVDITQNVVISMDVYRSGSGAYTCNVLFNNKAPEKVVINGEDTSSNGFSLNYNVNYHVIMYFEELNSSNEGLYFTVTAGGNSNRMIISNLKVEYGYTPTKFCISDNDAAVNKNPNILSTVGENASSNAAVYVKTQADNTGNSFTGSLSEGVMTVSNATIPGDEYIIEAQNFTTMPTSGKVYTLAFTAKAAAGVTNIKSLIAVGSGQLGEYTYADYTRGIFNNTSGLATHALTTEWKRYYARFYVSDSAILSSQFRPIIAGAGASNEAVLDFTGKQGGSRTFYVKDIVLQEGYTPSDDQVISDNAHTKSLINQTSSEIELSVENRMRKSGIRLTADGVTINATKVAFTGADGVDYIRLGEDKDGVPYFIFCDANGNEVYNLGQFGLKQVTQITEPQSWTSLQVKAINDVNFDNTKYEFTAAEMYPILHTDPLSGYDYAANVTYYRYNAARTAGVWDTTQKPYNGLYYEDDSVDSNGLPVDPEQPVANSNDMWWVILRTRTYDISTNVTEVYGDFAIITNGEYYLIGTLGVRKNGSNYMFYNAENSIMNYLSYDSSNNVNESGELDLGRTQEALDKIGYYDNN